MRAARQTQVDATVETRVMWLVDAGTLIESRGLELAAIGACVATVAQLVDFGVYGNRIRWLDMSTHTGLFGVVSVLTLAAALAVSVVRAAATVTRRPSSIVLALLLAALLTLRILHPAHVILIAFPFGVATFVTVWWKVAPAGSRARSLLRLGSLVLVGSYVIHAFGTFVVRAPEYPAALTWRYEIALAIEHCSELAGWTIVAAGLVGALLHGIASRDAAR